MYKLVFIVTLCLSTINICAQKTKIKPTRQEAEEWIIAKFDKWKLNYTLYSNDNYTAFESPISLKFIEDKLVLETKSVSSTYLYYNVYGLNIGDIEKIKWEYDNLHLISRKTNVVDYYYSDKKDPKFKYQKEIIIHFDTSLEENLKIRLSNAFEHLKTFHQPSKDTKEAF